MENKIQIGEPSAPFRPYIKYYKYIESNMVGIFKVLPNTYVELYFNFTHINIYSPGTYNLDHSMVQVGGLHKYEQDIFTHIYGTDRNGGFVIVFQPQGFYNLFNIKSSDLCKFSIDGLSVFKRDIYDLWEELQTFPDIEGMISLVENYLLDYVKRASCRYDVINNIINYMDISKGMISVSQIYDIFRVTPRSLNRHFKNELGISPKELLNIFRITNAVKLINNDPNCSLTSVAYLCGYYDQSHFIKEIRRVLGLAPGKLKMGEGEEVSTQHNLLFLKAE